MMKQKNRHAFHFHMHDHSLIKYAREHDNLVISPHIAGATVESIIGARLFIAEKLAEYIKKKEAL